MPEFTKKPVTITAVQFTGSNWDEIREFIGVPVWFRPRSAPLNWAGLGTAEIYDETVHEAWLPVRDGHWIIKGLKGEFYPCDPIVFAESYNAA